MDCQTDDWVCITLDTIGLDGFARDTVEFVLERPL